MLEQIAVVLVITCLLLVSLLLIVFIDWVAKTTSPAYGYFSVTDNVRDWLRGVWLLGSIALGWWPLWPVRAALRLAAGVLWCAVVPLVVGVFVLPVRVARGGKITPRWAVAWLEWVAGLR